MASREEIQRRIDIMQGYLDGEEIETLVADKWVDLNDVISPSIGPKFGFDEDQEYYRIKPKPREIWVTHTESGEVIEARVREFVCIPNRAVIKYREVIEDE